MDLESMSEEQIEEEAIKQGYNPNYTGDNAKTPKQFLEDGEQIFSHVRKDRDNLRQELADVKQSTQQILSMAKQSQDKARQEGYEDAKRKFTQQQLKAVEDSDTDAFVKAKEGENKLDEEYQAGTQGGDAQKGPEAFMQANPDLFDTREAQKITQEEYSFHLTRAKAKPETYTSEADFLAAVAKTSRERLQQQNETLNLGGIEDTGTVQTPASGGQRRGDDKSFKNLPQDAKDAFETYFDQGLYDKEGKRPPKEEAQKEYLALYPW